MKHRQLCLLAIAWYITLHNSVISFDINVNITLLGNGKSDKESH